MHCKNIIENYQAKNIEKFYFKIIRKRYRRIQKFKNLKLIANDYRSEYLKKSFLKNWHLFIVEDKQKRQEFY
jgi:hypothetical protein